MTGWLNPGSEYSAAASKEIVLGGVFLLLGLVIVLVAATVFFERTEVSENQGADPEVFWWKSLKDRQVHAFPTSHLDPDHWPDNLTALCGHSTDQVQNFSAGMPCVLCIAKAPIDESA
ncbi:MULTISPECIES: hypothetical protein [unclassified Crossiella]|uniref:hypothetical protein n=1 Tax=unclassified Crossiella TaxID=2620835 RepID=UPI001FFE54AA|nr:MULTISPECIES: hypothetical protein [unclassified Crossiella]MCK2240998.1 hypothetical protein [Crossiella sp. S99.2]MCK2253858.1 hypothetical protein [Crossiella sp. S99.1]